MARVYNFSAGPSMLPEKVLKQAQAELLEYGDSGQSVMEMSHRSKWFDAIITDTEATLRRVMNIPYADPERKRKETVNHCIPGQKGIGGGACCYAVPLRVFRTAL